MPALFARPGLRTARCGVFLKNPFARFEVYSIFDEDRVRVILNGGRDWVEFEKEHPVYIEAVRRQKMLGRVVAV